jgi:phage terminase large subunit
MNAVTLPDPFVSIYRAMCAPTPGTLLADALLAATTKAERDAVFDAAAEAVRSDALGYLSVPAALRERERRLSWMRADPARLRAIRAYYSEHLADFISDFGVTLDPRLLAKGKAALQAFTLWPAQVALVHWMLERWQRGEMGVVVKSRDVGASWVSMALLCSLCVFRENFAGGIASATEVKLDRTGDPDTLFYKGREFAKNLPAEFNGGYDQDRTSAYMRLSFPLTGSSITGEAGEQAGRGGRKSLYFVDESAHFERPQLIDASLAATTDCRIDISSVRGIGTPFYDKAHNASIARFDLSWRDDPRKDQAWYDKKRAELDPVVVAQEIDADFSASVAGVIIRSEWVQAAVGLAERLGLKPTGKRISALDIADEGRDKNAFGVRHGMLLEHVESWSGQGSDLFKTTQRAFRLADQYEVQEVIYDADGMGAACRGDAKVINEQRTVPDPATQRPKGHAIRFTAHRGSESPLFPTRKVPRTGRTNEDLYANRKSQCWMHLQMRFVESFKASRGEEHDAEMLISINPKIPELNKLIAELTQVTSEETAAGKIKIEKRPDGSSSPNLADVVSYLYAPRHVALNFSQELLARI